MNNGWKSNSFGGKRHLPEEHDRRHADPRGSNFGWVGGREEFVGCKDQDVFCEKCIAIRSQCQFHREQIVISELDVKKERTVLPGWNRREFDWYPLELWWDCVQEVSNTGIGTGCSMDYYKLVTEPINYAESADLWISSVACSTLQKASTFVRIKLIRFTRAGKWLSISA